MRLVFDLESDGLLDELTVIHCIVARDLDTEDPPMTWGPEDISKAVEVLEGADELIAHNGMEFDIPAIQKIYPTFVSPPLVDTLLLSRLVFADLRERDFVFRKKNPSFPGQLIGSHSLMAWGHRLNEHKGDYGQLKKDEGKELGLKGDELTKYVWGSFSEEMLAYCVQDVVVTEKLYGRLMVREPSEESVSLEHDVARIIRRQEKYGFAFDVDRASELYATLSARSAALRDDLADTFPPWEVRTPFTPKRDNKTRGYKAGVTIDKVKLVEFNPDSRDHIALKLQEKYGWKPTAFTNEGKPKVDETVLSGLKYPEARALSEYLTVSKRIGQLSTGAQAWLKAEKEGRIHGRVNTNGAVTGRMTHSHPNIAQVPAGYAPYGKECRSLFRASPGRLLVGCDADGLEARCLAGYMAMYDKGEFINIILNGRKEDATDLHSRNAGVLGCDRDTAKTWFYAFLYGAGAAKLGSILSSGPARGTAAKKRFLDSLPALSKLVSGVQRRAQSRGYLTGLDGRRLPVRSSHAALNTLLQSAGAVLMKRALVILDEELTAQGHVPGEDYEFVANVHDEIQCDVKPEIAEHVGRTAADAIRKSGEYYNFRCPLAGNYDIGNTWADTH